MGNYSWSDTDLGINITEHFDISKIYKIIKKHISSKIKSPRQEKEYNYKEDLKNWEDEDQLLCHLNDEGLPLGYLYDQFFKRNYKLFVKQCHGDNSRSPKQTHNIILHGMNVATGEGNWYDYGTQINDTHECDEKLLKKMSKIRKELLEAVDLLSKDADMKTPDCAFGFIVSVSLG